MSEHCPRQVGTCQHELAAPLLERLKSLPEGHSERTAIKEAFDAYNVRFDRRLMEEAFIRAIGESL